MRLTFLLVEAYQERLDGQKAETLQEWESIATRPGVFALGAIAAAVWYMPPRPLSGPSAAMQKAVGHHGFLGSCGHPSQENPLRSLLQASPFLVEEPEACGEHRFPMSH